MILLYSLVTAVVVVVSAPLWLYRLATQERYRDGLSQRLGRVPAALREVVRGREVMWVHAVSVGEMIAATRLVKELEEALGDAFCVVISTTTRTGRNLARERFGAERVFYIPLDFAWAVRAYMRVLRPRAVVLMESELWPRMLYECMRAGVPVAVVNARISDRSFKRALWVPAVWTRTLRKVSLWLTQSEEDARRLGVMGVPVERVRVAGNLKYDVRAPKESRIAELILRAAGERPIVVAGSTVVADGLYEDQMVTAAWRDLRDLLDGGVQALLVLAPRHPEQFKDVYGRALGFRTLTATDLSIGVRSEEAFTTSGLGGDGLPVEIVVLDTIGDLAAVYGIAEVAFVGGSLVRAGGHNPLEPAQFGVPVVMGPSYENFRDIVEKMVSANGIRIVDDQDELGGFIIQVLMDNKTGRAMGERGRRVFEEQQGATRRTVAAVVDMILTGRAS